ncbi:MAG: NfeD family protein [Bacteroidales bacterium]|nr:NfeD family protein [Bacteroidales bacterium]
MSIGLIIFLILLGILLFLLEFLVVPGITVAGIGGAISIITALVLAFYYHGPRTGLIVLLATLLVLILTVVFMLKAGTWKKIMLNKSIDSRVDNVQKQEGLVKEGDTGSTVTRLNPMGRVIVNGQYYEAKSMDRLIDQGTDIVVLKVEINKLIVKPVILK